MEKKLPSPIYQWLITRGISDSTITEYQISWNGTRIVLPVHDSQGKILFNKYRRDPNSTEGPKYLYEKGGSSTLYGMKTFVPTNTVLLCEGELDCLLLISKGFNALSTTGGSSTFKEEWATLFKDCPAVYICYDTDDAGLKGSFHVQELIPNAQIIALPKEVKDVTEYFKNHTNEDFISLALEARNYPTPRSWRGVPTKKELNNFKKEYEAEIQNLMDQARVKREQYKSDKFEQYTIQMFMSRRGEVIRQIKYWQPTRAQVGDDRIQKAKAVSVLRFIKLNSQGFAQCVFHKDKNPSMYYYEKQNRVKCFSCDKLGDVIDVVQATNKVGLKEALDIILK